MIDLQIKRAVLQRGVQEQLATGAGANGNLASSTASSLSPQLSQDGGSQEQNKQCPPPPPPVEDVKINPGASPHNTSPVYAFSCMFYTKLTENRQGLTKKVSMRTKPFLFVPIFFCYFGCLIRQYTSCFILLLHFARCTVEHGGCASCGVSLDETCGHF